MKYFISCVTWYTSFPTPSSHCKFLENKASISSAAITPCRTAWVFNTFSTNWCGSAAGIVINFSTQCDSGELRRVESEQGRGSWIARDPEPLTQESTHPSLGLTLWCREWQILWPSRDGRLCLLSFFFEVLPFINLDTGADALTLSSYGSLTISLGHFEPQFSYF